MDTLKHQSQPATTFPATMTAETNELSIPPPPTWTRGTLRSSTSSGEDMMPFLSDTSPPSLYRWALVSYTGSGLYRRDQDQPTTTHPSQGRIPAATCTARGTFTRYSSQGVEAKTDSWSHPPPTRQPQSILSFSRQASGCSMHDGRLLERSGMFWR